MIVTEKEKTNVIFSSLLNRHYPVLYNQLCNILRHYHKSFDCVCHTKDYWVRDFMPIQMDNNVFVKFIYNPDYLHNKEKYKTDVDKVINNCPLINNFVFVNIPLVIDGGNMVFCKGQNSFTHTNFVVMTEKVLAENPEYDKMKIENILKCSFLDPDLTVVWLPWDRIDIFGHTDGIVRYIGINEKGKPKVLVNLELYEDKIANQMYEALAEHFEVIELRLSKYELLSWAYINCLQTEDFIIIPGLGRTFTDLEAMKQYHELFPEYKGNIYMVYMRNFIAEQGGALNCLTWTVKGDFNQVGKIVDRNDSDKQNKLPVQITLDDHMKNMPPF